MLSHRIAIIIPSTKNGNVPAPELHDVWVRKAKELFAKTFGGFTATPGMGGWLSDVHGLIEEPVMTVHSNTDDSGLNSLQTIREFAVLLATAMGQEAVSVEVDNALEFVSVPNELKVHVG